RAEQYTRCLIRELDIYSKTFSFEPCTIYIGGGTPSILSASCFTTILNSLRERISFRRLVEFTVEINPGTLDEQKMAAMQRAGVNRISIGAQSFDNSTLVRIGRRHTVRHIEQCIRIVRDAGIKNIGLDLISSIPGINMDLWQKTLDSAIQLHPNHVSVYTLTIEPGTIMAKSIAGNKTAMPTDNEQLAATNRAKSVLQSAGYSQYEISNYAQPGYECMHNIACWRGMDYFGLGPAASSRIGLSRWTNAPDINSYCNSLEHGNKPPSTFETLSPRSDALERLIFQFRLNEGVPDETLRKSPHASEGTLDAVLQRLTADNLIVFQDAKWRLTAKGCRFADFVAAEFV
ncbi:MAG: radical SAM family heme chaperone HemW, partial [Lentisphaerae bacterium]|nr:radical SAM family heme chaperone HemW [Lentisphaerota bacterium]